jgi:hypothetical protein
LAALAFIKADIEVSFLAAGIGVGHSGTFMPGQAIEARRRMALHTGQESLRGAQHTTGRAPLYQCFGHISNNGIEFHIKKYDRIATDDPTNAGQGSLLGKAAFGHQICLGI